MLRIVYTCVEPGHDDVFKQDLHV